VFVAGGIRFLPPQKMDRRPGFASRFVVRNGSDVGRQIDLPRPFAHISAERSKLSRAMEVGHSAHQILVIKRSSLSWYGGRVQAGQVAHQRGDVWHEQRSGRR